MYEEADFIPLSALQHYLYCPRQCALIHVEQVWTENLFTAEGRILHENADSGAVERRGNVIIARSLSLRSLQLGLSGKADVVEFQSNDENAGEPVPYPVEYKRGRAKQENPDAVQLCAQAMCLEEMLGREVPAGALFYGKKRRRLEVIFDKALREKVRRTARDVHAMVTSGITPPPCADDRCNACSLMETCMPDEIIGTARASRYLKKLIKFES